MNNRKLADYLEIAHKQRARQRGTFVTQFGTDSAAVQELDKELVSIEALIQDAKIYGSEEAIINGKPVLAAAANTAPADKK